LPTAKMCLLGPGLFVDERGSMTTGSEWRVVEQLVGQGVEAERLELLPRKPRRGDLGDYHRIDLGLDSGPYGGPTPSPHAFWMGSPVLTLVGSTVAGRAGECIATHAGMPELVTRSDDAFVARAVELASQPERLAELRRRARPGLEGSCLMDTARFARHL